MKLINRDTDNAIRAINYVAHSRNKIISVSEIAKKLKIPRPFLRKILQILQKKGMLKSYEGRGGGFRLAVSADKIFVVDLIKIFHGPVKLSDCIFKNRICPDIKHCILKSKIEHIEHIVMKELKALTIASLSSTL